MSENPGRERALEEFETPGALPGGANLPDAEARLLNALERELGVTLAPTVSRPRGLRSPRFLAGCGGQPPNGDSHSPRILKLDHQLIRIELPALQQRTHVVVVDDE